MFASSLNILSPALMGDEGTGRGIILRDPPTKCNCERPKKNVLCNICGLMIVGRIRVHCPKHPNTIFLFDLDQCPRCRAFSFMMQEFGCVVKDK